MLQKDLIGGKCGKEDRSGDHLILLAKNLTGYKNLIKLVSIAWIKGFYYKPRIDKELVGKIQRRTYSLFRMSGRRDSG